MKTYNIKLKRKFVGFELQIRKLKLGKRVRV